MEQKKGTKTVGQDQLKTKATCLFQYVMKKVGLSNKDSRDAERNPLELQQNRHHLQIFMSRASLYRNAFNRKMGQ